MMVSVLFDLPLCMRTVWIVMTLTWWELGVPFFKISSLCKPYGASAQQGREQPRLACSQCANQVYRINLEEGRFMTPLACKSPAVNATGKDVMGLEGGGQV